MFIYFLPNVNMGASVVGGGPLLIPRVLHSVVILPPPAPTAWTFDPERTQPLG